MVDSPVPAVVLGGALNGLGVARSLARAKVPVWLLDTDTARAEMHTRVARPLAVRALHGEALVDDLVQLGSSRFAGSRPVLFLTQEETVRTVSRHRERLSARYRFSLPPADIVEALQHKDRFQALVEKLGGPIPPLVHVRTPDDFATLAGLHYPVVVKPAARDAEYGRHFKKAYRVESATECVVLVARILEVITDVVVQEWIEGEDAAIHFCLQYLDRDGHVAASFTGRKLRSWPPQVGGTASCMPAPEASAELTQLTTEFFQQASVTGMASMEYKRDASTGEFRMVEPTIGRTDYQEEVATLNGVNLPHAAYCSELGLPPPAPERAPRATAWRVTRDDRRSAAAQGQSARSGFDGIDAIVDALWRWSDPLPWVLQTTAQVAHALRNRVFRLRSRRAPSGHAA